ncbi:hypothetical protein COCOBI_14-4470 [Coccomyxa sp. Obi]|nr:hypothetical protein COCOBI_14-4470 [Coccomyxa sp. Obi]
MTFSPVLYCDRASNDVQKGRLCSAPCRNMAADCWAHVHQTHWGQASKMILTWFKKDMPWVMAHNAASVTSLKRLELNLVVEKSPTTVVLLSWLLAQAPQLQLLFLRYPRELVVPPIRNLSHLIMASNDFTSTIAASIRQLRNLQTLWLGRAQLNLESACAEFDLASLPQLSDLGDLSSPVLFDVAHFRCLTHLNLKGRNIHIVLPQELPLQALMSFF